MSGWESYKSFKKTYVEEESRKTPTPSKPIKNATTPSTTSTAKEAIIEDVQSRLVASTDSSQEKQKKNNSQYILAWGDSLTNGYYNTGQSFYPYATKLQRLLKNANFNYKMVAAGRDGERTDEMAIRLDYWIEQVSSDYKYGIICGGLNDMADQDMKIPNVITNLKKMCTTMLDNLNCTHIFLTTVPITLGDDVYDFYREKKATLNELIRKIPNGKNIHLVDIAMLINLRDMTEEDRKKYWDDHLHYTKKGYDLMAKHIFAVMRPILK